MRLDRLRLAGFKSFVDPTEMAILDGLTGVVGPNGCGKSNLLEALRWVMGETRPTAMRGDGMEDVIFAGSSSRPARSFAEVSLMIDNVERRAPQGFNEADTLEVVRRITRDAGSAYKANGRDVRARDVQMLFADASTGAHSPALVRQGQIAELINAKPVARRRILEEAAGISGLYQRRHEAELKLRAAEANLARVDDVVDQLAQQLATLARQARSAARYREIGEALRRAEGLLLWRRWREAEDARMAAEAALAAAATGVGTAERGARAAAAGHEAATAALPAAREEAAIAGAVLQRLAVERDGLDARAAQADAAIEELTRRHEQIAHDVDREVALTRDAAATLDTLAEEARTLEAGRAGEAERVKAADGAARAATAALSEREAALSHLTETMAVLVARHQSAERAVAEARTASEREGREADRLARAEQQAEAALEEAARTAEEARVTTEKARGGSAEAEARLAGIEAERADVQARDAEAAAASAAADRNARALAAEAETLRRLLADAPQGAERLLDRIGVAPGYEAALGAALGRDLEAPFAADGGDGWADLDAPGPEARLPAAAEPLGRHVTAPPLLARRLARIGVVAAEDGSRLQAALGPGERLVSRAGDLWRWDGLRRAAGQEGAEAALRLQQANRLAALEGDLRAATQAATEAAATRDAASAALRDLGERERAARAARRAADEAVAAADRALTRGISARDAAAQRRDGLGAAAVRHRRAAEMAAERLTTEAAALRQLGDLGAARAELQAAREAVEAVRMTMLTRRSALDEARREAEARRARLASIAEERARWQSRRATADARMADLRSRAEEATRQLAAAQARPADIAAARDELQASLDAAASRNRAAADGLAAAEAAERDAAHLARDAEREASTAREARAVASARVEAAADAARRAAERIAEEAETDPGSLGKFVLAADDAGRPAERALAEIEAEVARLKRARDGLGAVNLRAEEDAAEVRQEHDALLTEKADLEEAIGALRRGIAGLNREGRERLVAAYAEVNANFATLFTHLFGGGEARLEMVESDDPLEAGLEILCQPPGKKLSHLSLFSGGEQTLTALALIFAVFLANPAPICVLDEVDAPLDDANVTRFCDLLDEMTRRADTRFLIITHHALTMARMDRLYGVTMAEQGVSQLVSVDLRAAEQLAA
jgi:chromosome segregation protein